MKSLSSWISALFVCALFPSAVNAQAAPIRIMPLGDSITDGSSFDSPDGSGGYRLRLYNHLTTAGYNVDYIGSLTVNSNLLAEKNHEGHSGWKIDQLDSNIAGWLANEADPDVVLMHIGTNDFGTGTDINNAINRLDALILKIATLRPYCHIIVTNLMERGEPHNTNIQTLFNPYVQARVNAHATAGRRVTFLDMRAACPLADMPDSLHPNQTGYDKMADAWLPAIQAVIGPDGDAVAPAIVRASGKSGPTSVDITFSKPVADTAATLGNYSISGGLVISNAVLGADKRTVTLTTSQQAKGSSYTVTVNGVIDRTTSALALPANSTVAFNTAILRGYLNNVPESVGYTLAYSVDLPNIANFGVNPVPYNIDNRRYIGPFSRVAYYLELQSATGELQYLWTSMNAFTTDVEKIGVPTLASGVVFQQSVTSMNVFSNAAGITSGTGINGNIEFWPTDYSSGNATVPSASPSAYDFGDTRSSSGAYGSMQIHNTTAGQTLFGFNNWGGTGVGSPIDLGIGNNPSPTGGGLDWTFSNNGANYTVKRMQVLVQTSDDTTKPTLVSAEAVFGGTQVIVKFSEPIAAGSVNTSGFSLNGGVAVVGFTVNQNQREINLLTTKQPAATPLTLTVSGIRDSSASANLILPGSTIAVSALTLPAEITSNVGAPANGYELVASIDLPVTGNFNASDSAYIFDGRSGIGPFTRVAYYLETQKTGQPAQYVWTSMDAFAVSRARLGIPTLATNTAFQQNVTNLEVHSNVPGVVTGTSVSGGNIEFWPNSYDAANANGVPLASGTHYDTGDNRFGIGSSGYGCMQVHNHDAAANQTVFAINHFGEDGGILDIGIGNNPAPGTDRLDWTFANNASTYTRRILHVLVLPGSTTSPAVVANVAEAANYQLAYSVNLPSVGNLVGGNGFADYAVNHSADIKNFSRVAYYLELQKTGDAVPRFIWTSMDAFTTNVAKIGIPTLASGAIFQQTVSNMNVVSNVSGVVTGSGISTGNIEFWPHDYAHAITTGILPGNPGDGGRFDYNDTRASGGSYGSMQIHNYGAGQTLFAINNWGANGNNANVLDMGIGNNPNGGQSPDYTQSNNGNAWDLRRVLHVYVLPAEADGPVIVSARPSATLNRLIVEFDKTLSDSSASPINFSIPGLAVTHAALVKGNKAIALTTSAQTSGTSYTIAVSGVRDRSSSGNLILPGATVSFTAFTKPAILASIPETEDYQLIYQLAIPSTSPRWNSNSIPYSVNESQFGEILFDRVAYLMELDGNWAYVSFDRHTNLLTKIGIPAIPTNPTALQQTVTNMNVVSNKPGVTNGTGITTGNIEFWGGNYNGTNANNIPNASAQFDFGDTMEAGGAGYGSMQIHNYGAAQTIMAYNNWGNALGGASTIGLGNNPDGQPDWTFTANANTYTNRNLYVLVRPGGTSVGDAPVFFSHPASRLVTLGSTATLAVLVSGQGPFTYQWRKDGQPIAGAISSWIEIVANLPTDAGSYDVVVTGPTSVSATSLPGVITANSPPVFSSYAFSTVKNFPATVLTEKILARASDIDADTLSLTATSGTSTKGGSVSLIAEGVLYTPANNDTGADSFTVTIADGRGGSVVATINVTVTDGSGPSANQSSIALNGDGSVDVLFYGIPGRSYDVQRSINLLTWSTLETVEAAANGTLPFHDSEPPVGSAFYRTRETP